MKIGKSGARAGSVSLIAVCKEQAAAVPEVGYVVSKKVGKAVQRNKVKRRLRSLVRENEKEFTGGYSFVFIAKPMAYQRLYLALKSDFLQCMRRSKWKASNELSE
jgi:ribonuclease P protein component